MITAAPPLCGAVHGWCGLVSRRVVARIIVERNGLDKKVCFDGESLEEFHVKIEDNRTRAEILTISEAVHRYAVEISPHACDDMSDPTCPCSSPLSQWCSFGRMWIL